MKHKKSFFLTLFFAAAMLLPLSGCGETDYFQYVSDCRSDLFLARTEDFEVTVSCLTREYPFAQDGYAGALGKTVEATLVENTLSDATYEIYFLEDVPRGGEMSFRSVSSDRYYSRGVEEFPKDTISLRIVRDGKSQEIAATSVKNQKTLSPFAALEFALSAEKDAVKKLTSGNRFAGELHVRLIRRDKNYYYVGIVDRNKRTVCMLLDSETGKVLARREKLD